MTTSTRDEVRAMLAVTLAVGETIKELGSVPSGHLYAALMEKMSIHTYQMIIGALKKSGLVSESGHVLTWVGP